VAAECKPKFLVVPGLLWRGVLTTKNTKSTKLGILITRTLRGERNPGDSATLLTEKPEAPKFFKVSSSGSECARATNATDVDAYTILLLKLLRMRGSIWSRKASPTKVKAKMTPAKVSPGKIANQGATSKKSWASRIIVPQLM
jgi:hypothetical protein